MKKVLNIKILKKFFTLALVLFITAGCFSLNSSKVYANDKIKSNISTNDLKKSFKNMQNIANKSKELTNQELKFIKSKFNEDLDNNNFNLQVSNENLDLENIKSLKIEDTGSIFKSITIPIIGGEYSTFSSLTVVYDLYNNILTYSETLITKSYDNKFEITSYLEGEKISSKNTGIDYVGNEKLEEELKLIEEASKEIETYGDKEKGVGAVAACIGAIAGVDGLAAYLIAGTCAVSCPAIVPICVACIAGVCTLGSASIAGVVACFNFL